ncbi:MAG: BBP7 family outer membrane beta-barrel protein [Gemmataceae bacterium]
MRCHLVAVLLGSLCWGLSAGFSAAGSPECGPGTIDQAIPGSIGSLPPVGGITQPTSPGNRLYSELEGLLWWLKPAQLPVLATSNDALLGIPPGALGQPGTVPLISGRTGTDMTAGARALLGYWLDDEEQLGIEASYFFLAQTSTSRQISSPGGLLGTPTIFRPFDDVVLGTPNAQFIAGPGLAGGLQVDLAQRMMGAEALVRSRLLNQCEWRVDALGGFRFLALDENLDIRSRSIDPLGFAPTILEYESFAARNRFYGAEVGAEAQWQYGRLGFRTTGKLGLGVMNQVMQIRGSSLVSDPLTGQQESGATSLFAQSTNIGRYSRNQLAFIPEIGVTANYRLTDCLNLSVGYTFLWISSVARPDRAIDFQTTVATIGAAPAGAPHPAFTFHDDSFWAQGIRLGIELSY